MGKRTFLIVGVMLLMITMSLGLFSGCSNSNKEYEVLSKNLRFSCHESVVGQASGFCFFGDGAFLY